MKAMHSSAISDEKLITIFDVKPETQELGVKTKEPNGKERTQKPVKMKLSFKYLGKEDAALPSENIEPQLDELADLLREKLEDKTVDEVNENFDHIMKLIKNINK